ncbi:DUF4230 domain-containing protein [Bacillus infantis]|uniref:DUF4230 domain-containing protein n=1 Tax=Bacillus infantis TaxID=324767 RepID=A0A5D4SP15_9BACI|nr:DUF4230 domain-containing protein [Bacillus infantis]TYS64084.1 DUF4230 domain-containing protein [Bacillus infantis]
METNGYRKGAEILKKEQEVLEQMEALMKELKTSRKQAASAAALEGSGGAFTFSRFLRYGFRKWSWKIGLLLLSLIMIGILLTAGIFYFYTGSSAQEEKGSFIEQVRGLSTLASSQALVKAVIEKEDNELFGRQIETDLPGTKRKLLLIVPGTVTAGVDLEQVGEKDIKVSEEDKRIEVSLPKASILQEPSLDLEHVQTFSASGIFRDDVNWDEAYSLAAEAKELVEAEAIDQGILELAEKNAEKTISEFFGRLGYEASVSYKGDSDAAIK